MKLEYSKLLHDKKILLIAGLFLLVFVLVCFSFSYFIYANRYIAIPPTAPYVPQELVITYRENRAPHVLSESKRIGLENRLKEFGVISQEKVFDSNSDNLSLIYKLSFKENVDLAALQVNLATIDEIRVSEPNFIIQPQEMPNDQYYSQLWGMQKINMPTAWDTTTGSDGVTVAVLDTGAAISHPDLASHIVSPYSTVTGNTNVTDTVGHGTHVAGTIGAIGNNSIGVVGVNWNVKIMPIKVCFSAGCTTTAVAQGIVRAANSGVDVINMSLGGEVICSSNSLYQSAINQAVSRGVVVVAAAGNESQDASSFSPASCDGVLTVGASTQNDTRASFSNYGGVVDISAPGVDILSTVPNGYNTNNGTSMSSPHVAGAAALLLASNPNLSSQDVVRCLVDNADQISASNLIGPRLNVSRAIEECRSEPNEPTPTYTPSPTMTPTTSPEPTVDYVIQGKVFQDNNSNSVYDSGDIPLSNETVTLTGGVSDTASTLTDGTFVFDDLFEGNFNTNYKTISQPIELSPLQPTANVYFIVTKNVAQPTPTIVVNPGPNLPTNTPTPTLGENRPSPTRSSASPSRTSTPKPKLYKCEFDPECASGHKNIQLCPLICTTK